MKTLINLFILLSSSQFLAQEELDTLNSSCDSAKYKNFNQIIVSASRISETILKSPASIVQLTYKDALHATSVFDAIGNLKGIQVITPSLGFKVINSRGFANTTNVRFSHLIDGIDNQAPHIGAPIANAMGANELDVEKVEIIQGTASALYGLNAVNGLVNILTKSPFKYKGLSFQQVSGINHLGDISLQPYLTGNLRFAKVFKTRFAIKINLSYTHANDWYADNQTDLASTLNESTGLTGNENPAYDEVNGYGNESSNRKTLSLNGKQYAVARTGYREVDVADYGIKNYKSDFGFYFRPKKNQEFSFVYKNALINTIYQRSNRFRLEDYLLQQFSMDYHTDILQFRSYYTLENTGKSYNLRSLAENMDRSFKSDDQWFSDYATFFNNAFDSGMTIAESHKQARLKSDQGRFEPGTDTYNQKMNELIKINNWDYGAALRVKASLFHSEGLINWDKLFSEKFKKNELELLSGVDFRSYIIVPDGNYFINPLDSLNRLVYSKLGFFIQVSKMLFKQKIKISGTLRADKSDFFTWKINPRITAVYSANENAIFRLSFQNGYRFPSIFEGFSNVNSGGVKRVGGLKVMSNGVFENSFTKSSIDEFQSQVNRDINTNNLSKNQAIEKNKSLLKKNPYSYLEPEFVTSFELGFRTLAIKKRLFVDLDFYYNIFDNFIAQVEASVPKTADIDSIPFYLYTKSSQDRYRLWTNSQSRTFNYGSSLGLRFHFLQKYTFQGNVTLSKLDKVQNKDGLEEGFNTPLLSLNGALIAENIWKKMSASITFKHQTKYEYISFLVSGEVPSFYNVDCQLNYYFEKKQIRLKIAATNLLNIQYYTILGGSNVGGLYSISIQVNIP